MCHRCLSNSYEGCRWVGSCDDFGVIIIFKHLQNLSCQRLDFSSALSLQFGWLIPHGCSVGTRILRGRSYFRHLIFIQTGTGCNQAVLPAFSRMRTWLEVPWTKRSSSSSTWDNRDTLGERRLTSDQSLHNWLWFFLLWMNLSENWRTAKFVKRPLSTKNRTGQVLAETVSFLWQSAQVFCPSMESFLQKWSPSKHRCSRAFRVGRSNWENHPTDMA